LKQTSCDRQQARGVVIEGLLRISWMALLKIDHVFVEEEEGASCLQPCWDSGITWAVQSLTNASSRSSIAAIS
jgi:hypothetical protein